MGMAEHTNSFLRQTCFEWSNLFSWGFLPQATLEAFCLNLNGIPFAWYIFFWHQFTCRCNASMQTGHTFFPKTPLKANDPMPLPKLASLSLLLSPRLHFTFWHATIKLPHTFIAQANQILFALCRCSPSKREDLFLLSKLLPDAYWMGVFVPQWSGIGLVEILQGHANSDDKTPEQAAEAFLLQGTELRQQWRCFFICA